MNASVLTIIVRLLLSLWLCWEIYKETGPFTGLGFFLVFIVIELFSISIKYNRKLIDEIKLTGSSVIDERTQKPPA